MQGFAKVSEALEEWHGEGPNRADLEVPLDKGVYMDTSGLALQDTKLSRQESMIKECGGFNGPSGFIHLNAWS